jgi:hypothetical protein
MVESLNIMAHRHVLSHTILEHGVLDVHPQASGASTNQHLWATNTDVRPEANSVRLSMMPRSVAVSSAEVASSQINSFGDLEQSTAH